MMLARSANGLFWMSRYLERAEHTARLLITQFDSMEDRPVEDIDDNWRRIFLSIGRSPLGGELTDNYEDEDLMLADSFTLADDLTFELANGDSILSSLHFARENARQIRNMIGRQFWTRLNTAYLELKSYRIEQIWDNQPKSFYSNAEDTARTLSGILDGSVYRDDGWNFLQLGRYLERMQQVSSLLDAQIQVFSQKFKFEVSDWSSLLLVCNAQLAFRRQHSLLLLRPRQVIEFLITDAALPYSILHALDCLQVNIDEVAGIDSEAESNGINGKLNAIRELCDLNRQSGALTDAEVCERLRGIQSLSREMNDDIASAYFFN